MTDKVASAFRAIQSIVDASEKLDNAPPVGILTGINRDHWTEVRYSPLQDNNARLTTYLSPTASRLMLT